MTTQIIQIGNSQGIRIPKTLLDLVHLPKEVELEAVDNHIIIKPSQKPRASWDKKFRSMAEHNDDKLLDARYLPKQSTWDDKEWEW